MEERVGILWHRLATRLADKSFAGTGVELSSVSHSIAIMFRALGGDHGIKVRAGAMVKHGARRTLVQKLAGTHKKIDTAWVNNEALHLPPLLNVYPDAKLNRDLYFWLTALCAQDLQHGLTTFSKNQIVTLQIIKKFPGLRCLYFRLVAAEIARRPSPDTLPADEARQERAIQKALRHPGTVGDLPPSCTPHQHVPLWIRYGKATSGSTLYPDAAHQQTSQQSAALPTEQRRRAAEYTQLQERNNAMLLFRPETILSWTEYAKTEHETSENEDDSFTQAADDLDVISISRDGASIAKRLRMELDIINSGNAATPVEGDELLPEWDYHTQKLVPDQCRTKTLPVNIQESTSGMLPAHLTQIQRRLKRSLIALNPHHSRLKEQRDGNELDLDAYIKHCTNKNHSEYRLYIDSRKRERNIATLLLADLSLSTDAWIGNSQRVIDAIRDSMFLFAESLYETKDPFALYGFSSIRRTATRLYSIKSFDESYTDTVRRRINSIEPTAYTRMGAAIRKATALLSQKPARDHLLLIITDGKPNDTDHYEGRYGIEDTRMSLIEAKKLGMRIFCVTIDQEANGYMPHIFGKNNFIVIRNPSELPTRLALLYHQLTRTFS